MTAPDLTPEQAAKLAEFEAAPDAPESVRARVAEVIFWGTGVASQVAAQVADAVLDVLRGDR